MFDSPMLHGVKVPAVDLNHLRALHILLEEAHVARAARRLGITAAAASNALRRLRDDLGDPLLIRSGRGLVRTPMAEELRAPARDVLAAAARLFEVAAPFQAATFDGELVLTTSDRVAEVLLPALDRLLLERAPRARLRVRTMTVGIEGHLRDHGGVAVVPEMARERGLRGEPLFVEDFRCVLRRGHPLSRGPLSARRLAEAEHVVVAPLAASPRGPVDDALAGLGLSRRVTRVVTSFALAVPLLVGSDRVATLPQSFAVRRGPGLVTRALPFALAPIQMQMAWYPGHEVDPKHAWFQALLRDAVAASGLRRPASDDRA
jgi:DNA-binding transcriptional LysR family regulator